MTPINENIKLLEKIRTKPWKQKVERGGRVFKTTKEKVNFSRDVLLLKRKGYHLKEIAEYFNIGESAVNNISAEDTRTRLENFKKEKIEILVDWMQDFNETLNSLKEQLETVDKKDHKNVIGYYGTILKYYKEQATMLGIRTEVVEIKEQEDPLDKVMRLARERIVEKKSEREKERKETEEKEEEIDEDESSDTCDKTSEK